MVKVNENVHVNVNENVNENVNVNATYRYVPIMRYNPKYRSVVIIGFQGARNIVV